MKWNLLPYPIVVSLKITVITVNNSLVWSLPRKNETFFSSPFWFWEDSLHKHLQAPGLELCPTRSELVQCFIPQLLIPAFFPIFSQKKGQIFQIRLVKLNDLVTSLTFFTCRTISLYIHPTSPSLIICPHIQFLLFWEFYLCFTWRRYRNFPITRLDFFKMSHSSSSFFWSGSFTALIVSNYCIVWKA